MKFSGCFALFLLFECCTYAAEVPEAMPPLLTAQNVYFSNPMPLIRKKIRETQKGGHIHADYFAMTDREFSADLLDAHGRGVNVEITLGGRLAYMCSADVRRFKESGMKVQLRATHGKAIVIQPGKATAPEVIIGSANATKGAYHNKEIGIVVSDDPQLVQDITDIWDGREGQRGEKRKPQELLASPVRASSGRKFHTPKRSKPNCAIASEVRSSAEIMEDALESMPFDSPGKKEVVVTTPNFQASFLRSLLNTANKNNTYLHINIDAPALNNKNAEEHDLLRQLAEHPRVRIGRFNPEKKGRKVWGKWVPDALHGKALLRMGEKGSSVRPLFIDSTGNQRDARAHNGRGRKEEENITVASLMEHDEAAIVGGGMKAIPMAPL